MQRVPCIRKLLLEKGYFSPKIPHIFNSVAFAATSHDLLCDWQDRARPPTWSERYNSAREGLHRREMQVPNPVSQLYVANLMAEHWGEIWHHNKASQISESKCRIDEKHGINITPHHELREKRLQEMAAHSHVLKADINRFFPSIYTHKIRKALLRGGGTPELGDKLDKVVRMCNGNQTVGIPIGPHTSHVVAEIIMSAIDREVEEATKKPLKGYRHVDDYFLCFDSYNDAETALAAIEKAAAAYELAVKDEKTEILQSINCTEAMWPHQLQNMDAYRKEKEKREALTDFARNARNMGEEHFKRNFNFTGLLLSLLLPPEEGNKHREDRQWLLQFASEAFALAKKYPNDSVMKYALDILEHLPLTRQGDSRDEQESPSEEGGASARLSPENWRLYENVLIRIMTAYPYTVGKVAQILRKCRDYYELDNDKLSGVVSSLICKHAPLEHHSEVAWALWLAKVLKLDIEDAGKYLPAVQSGVCALLALDNVNAGLIRGITPSDWDKDFSKKGLTNRRWLLAYEAPRKGWSGEKSAGYIEHHEFFAALHGRDVSFYDEQDDTPPPSVAFFY